MWPSMFPFPHWPAAQRLAPPQLVRWLAGFNPIQIGKRSVRHTMTVQPTSSERWQRKGEPIDFHRLTASEPSHRSVGWCGPTACGYRAPKKADGTRMVSPFSESHISQISFSWARQAKLNRDPAGPGPRNNVFIVRRAAGCRIHSAPSTTATDRGRVTSFFIFPHKNVANRKRDFFLHRFLYCIALWWWWYLPIITSAENQGDSGYLFIHSINPILNFRPWFVLLA